LRFLLDTHIVLWVLAEPDKLSNKARALIADPANDCVSSAVVVWEMAIKHARNRGQVGDMPISGDQAIRLADAAAIMLIDISPEHASLVGNLPPVHRDPFDRLLIAQAICEDRILLTHDVMLQDYGACVMPL
jgi:PIN domain nuclease of toxin-antitoxin system